jgi:hypothetical protein
MYKQIKNYEGLYWINENGIVINKKYRIVKSRQNNKGYLIINLYKEGIAHTFLIHRLLAFTFLECPNKNYDMVDHINGNPLDNRLCNLRFIDKAGNNRHRIKITNKNGYIGVYKRNSRFCAVIRSEDGIKKYLGSFDTPEEAHEIYMEEYNKIMEKYNFTRMI